MEISKADQITLDDALVAHANQLKIGKCILRIKLGLYVQKDANSKFVYDVLKLTPFYKAFQVSADVLEIYMQDLVHSGEIEEKITNVNVNKLHQPWRSFAAIINKCLSGKTSYDSLRLSQAQILWGMYNNKKIENKNTKKGNAMYYPRFTKLIVNFVMVKDPSIPRRNKSSITRSSTTPESYKEASHSLQEKKAKKIRKGKRKAKGLETIFEAILTKAEQLKIITKRSRKETHNSHANGSGADEGTGVSPGVLDATCYGLRCDFSWKTHSYESEMMVMIFISSKLITHDDETTHEEETNEDDTFDPIVHTPSHVSSSDDDDSDNEVKGVDVEGEKSDEDATYLEDQGNEADRDTNANLEGRDGGPINVLAVPDINGAVQYL
ncbi:hypothetical protein Tco_0459039 [Tanacetum coccineum]